MPIYEYQCEKCHHHLEALQKISDKPLRECPECGKHSLKRLLSAPLFRLVGSGWYETDFKSDQETKRNLAGRDETPADGGDKDTAKASDAKPEKAAKPAAKTGDKKIMVTKPAPKTGAAARPKAKSKPAPRKTAKAKARRR
jgi:putative FmdB family regulatory protein